MKRFPTLLSSTLAAFLLVLSAGFFQARAEILLSTDFTGRTIDGLVVSNSDWGTPIGFEDPGDLTVNNEAPGTLPGIFDTPASQGHLAPDKNVGNEGPWSVDVPLVLAAGTGSITIESVDVDWQHFNNAGALQGPSRNVNWTASVTGSTSGLLGTVTASNVSGVSGVENLVFSPPLELNAAETYVLNIRAASSATIGNNTGLDGLTVNGTAGAGGGPVNGITRIDYDRDSQQLTLRWRTRPGQVFSLKFSRDFRNWDAEVDDTIPAAAKGEETELVFDLSGLGLEGERHLFFRFEPGG